MQLGKQCKTCTYYKGGGVCEAFPDGIPLEIATGEFSHTRHYKQNGINDGGITYNADPIKLAEYEGAPSSE